MKLFYISVAVCMGIFFAGCAEKQPEVTQPKKVIKKTKYIIGDSSECPNYTSGDYKTVPSE